MSVPYKDHSEIEAVVKGFESCTTAKENFRHRDHLAVAVWYLRSSNAEDSLEKMRTGLNRFLNYHGVDRQKYKEDLTAAWINVIDKLISELGPELSLVEVANIVHERLGDKQVTLDGNGSVSLSE